MDFLGLVNHLLSMGQQATVSVLSTDVSEWAYKAQLCVNDAIRHLSLILRIKSRQDTFTFDTVVGQRTYVLPKQFIFPLISLKQGTDNLLMTPMSAIDYDLFSNSNISTFGINQYYLETSGVDAQPAAAGEVIYAVSSSSDTTKVVIQGYDTSNNFVVEELTLNSTSEVNTTATFKKIISISKGTTNGTITFRNAGSTTTYLILNPLETMANKQVLGLYPTPQSVATVTGRGYISIPPLQYANQVPAGFGHDTINAIVAVAFAKFMEYDPKQTTWARESTWQLAYKEIGLLLKDNADDGVQYQMKSPYYGVRRISGMQNPLDQ